MCDFWKICRRPNMLIGGLAVLVGETPLGRPEGSISGPAVRAIESRKWPSANGCSRWSEVVGV